MKYHRPLMQAILYDKVQIAKAVNATARAPPAQLRPSTIHMGYCCLGKRTYYCCFH